MKRYSILNNLDKCFYCNRPKEHIHEVFFGKNRQTSIKNGFCVGLRNRCHMLVHDASHYPLDENMDLHLKIVYQKEYLKTHTKDEFIKLIGQDYFEKLKQLRARHIT